MHYDNWIRYDDVNGKWSLVSDAMQANTAQVDVLQDLKYSKLNIHYIGGVATTWSVVAGSI